VALPVPAWPDVALSGFCFSQAISSCMVLAGMEGRAITRTGWVATSEMGSKSFTTS
jgi:hypothetical protein